MNDAENTVIVLSIAKNEILSMSIIMFTDSVSFNIIDDSTNVISASDALVNQSALIIAEKIFHTLTNVITDTVNYANVCL